VQVAKEWTAPSDNTQLAAQAVQWIDNYGMALPEGGGEDFFIHDGTQKDTVGFPIYTNWLSNLKSLSGSYPQQPVAVYVDYSQAYGNTSGGSLLPPENEITDLWDELPGRLRRRHQPGGGQRHRQALAVQGDPADQRRRRQPDLLQVRPAARC
jgi:hypothetical protein